MKMEMKVENGLTTRANRATQARYDTDTVGMAAVWGMPRHARLTHWLTDPVDRECRKWKSGISKCKWATAVERWAAKDCALNWSRATGQRTTAPQAQGMNPCKQLSISNEMSDVTAHTQTGILRECEIQAYLAAGGFRFVFGSAYYYCSDIPALKHKLQLLMQLLLLVVMLLLWQINRKQLFTPACQQLSSCCNAQSAARQGRRYRFSRVGLRKSKWARTQAYGWIRTHTCVCV